MQMGAVLSINASGIFMNKLLADVIKNSNIKSKLCLKYVDDILCIILEDKMDTFLSLLNIYNKSIKFTKEIETEKSIRFSGIKINRENGKIITEWTKKENTSDIILNYFLIIPNI